MSESEIHGAPEGVERALTSVDAAKRETLRTLILGAAFVVPVVASFSIDGLTSSATADGVCSPNMLFSGRACAD
jgi:hypothetical protein